MKMRKSGIVLGMIAVIWSLPGRLDAADFLGAELCRDHVTTGVVFPVDSGLKLRSVEKGEDNGLLLVVYATEGDVMEHLDALMSRITGKPGISEDRSMQWSGNNIVAFASLIKSGTVAMALSSDGPCRRANSAVAGLPEGLDTERIGASPDTEARILPTGNRPSPETEASGTNPEKPAEAGELPAAGNDPDFSLRGPLKYSRAISPWVDVMGIVENGTERSYRLVVFDLSLYDLEGQLICSDTISVGGLKPGQAHAFRDSINCPDFDAARVASFRLQFSGAAPGEITKHNPSGK